MKIYKIMIRSLYFIKITNLLLNFLKLPFDPKNFSNTSILPQYSYMSLINP